jgi:hypothetical protein
MTAAVMSKMEVIFIRDSFVLIDVATEKGFQGWRVESFQPRNEPAA